MFVEPTIPLENLSPTIADTKRSIVDWRIPYRSLQNKTDTTIEEADKLAAQTSKSSPRRLVAPPEGEETTLGEKPGVHQGGRRSPTRSHF
jgi:hypothetical protein